MSDPNPWHDLLNEAYVVVSILGLGGYLLAMLAL